MGDWESILFGGAVGGIAAAGLQIVGQHRENRTQRLLTAYSEWVVSVQEVVRRNQRYFFEGAIAQEEMNRLPASSALSLATSAPRPSSREHPLLSSQRKETPVHARFNCAGSSTPNRSCKSSMSRKSFSTGTYPWA
jgi:hypothetical protein